MAILVRIGSSSFGRHVAVIAGGSAVAQAIPILLTPVLARLYSPADMGLLGLYTAFISFAANATTLGYSQAIVSGKTEQEGADLTALSGLLVLPLSLVGATVLLLLTGQGWLGFGELPLWTSVPMAISLVLTGLYFTLRYWLVRVGNYPAISTATVAQSCGRMGTQVTAGLVGMGWAGMIVGEVVGRAFGLVNMWKATRRTLPTFVSEGYKSRLITVARRYRKFPLLTAPSSMLNSVALVIPVPLLTMYFGVYDAGQFAIASRIMLLPISLVGASVGDVFHNRIARLSREQPDRSIRLFLTVAGSLFVVGLLPLVIVTKFGEVLFETILGSEWHTAGSIAVAITPWVLMQLVVSPVSRVVQVYQGQEFKLFYDVFSLASVAGVIALGGSQEWSLVKTCTLLGWAQALVYGLYFILLSLMLKRHKLVNAFED